MLRAFALVVALAVQLCIGSPIPSTDAAALVQRGIHAKRADSVSGPKVNGANFPDPSIIKVGFTWYAFATRTIGSSIHIQVSTSTDFTHWTLVKNSDGTQFDALPNLPAWVYAASPNTWAPDVNRLDDGSYVMYYTASTKAQTNIHCLGAAKSRNVLGPYKPTSDQSLICNLPAGGAIDPAGYVENGQRYLLWKIDGNSVGKPTPIRITKVASDGVTLQGNIVTLLDNQGDSDDYIIEAPSLVKSPQGIYFLFFSPGFFKSSNYKVAYATAPSIIGPYTRNPDPLLLSGDDGLTAPGGADIDTDGRHVLFHANSPSGRSMYTALVRFSGTTASI